MTTAKVSISVWQKEADNAIVNGNSHDWPPIKIEFQRRKWEEMHGDRSPLTAANVTGWAATVNCMALRGVKGETKDERKCIV